MDYFEIFYCSLLFIIGSIEIAIGYIMNEYAFYIIGGEVIGLGIISVINSLK